MALAAFNFPIADEDTGRRLRCRDDWDEGRPLPRPSYSASQADAFRTLNRSRHGSCGDTPTLSKGLWVQDPRVLELCVS